jgi:hypothetical protein
MPQLNQQSIMVIQPELASGESIFWAAQPSPKVIFHKEDLYLIPFSLLWGGFAIFWEGGVSGFWMNKGPQGPWQFGALFGVPFVLIGQYMIWGRFFYTAWKKKRTHYAVTNRRVLVVQQAPRRKMIAAYLDTLSSILKEAASNGPGTLRFAPGESALSGLRGWDAWDSMAIGLTPIFRDIDDADYVYHLVSDLREKFRSSKPAS